MDGNTTADSEAFAAAAGYFTLFPHAKWHFGGFARHCYALPAFPKDRKIRQQQAWAYWRRKLEEIHASNVPEQQTRAAVILAAIKLKTVTNNNNFIINNINGGHATVNQNITPTNVRGGETVPPTSASRKRKFREYEPSDGKRDSHIPPPPDGEAYPSVPPPRKRHAPEHEDPAPVPDAEVKLPTILEEVLPSGQRGKLGREEYTGGAGTYNTTKKDSTQLPVRQQLILLQEQLDSISRDISVQTAAHTSFLYKQQSSICTLQQQLSAIIDLQVLKNADSMLTSRDTSVWREGEEE